MNDPVVAHDRAQDEYPRCAYCGQRAPTVELLARHKCRRCVGPIPPWRPWDAPRDEDVAA